MTGRHDWSKSLKVHQASEAKAKLLQILDDVERGETVQITRHGKPIARLVPEDTPNERERQIAEAKGVPLLAAA